MGMTIDEAIRWIEEKFKTLQDEYTHLMGKYQMMQADYETRLRADMVAMLTDLSMEIGEIEDGYAEFDEEEQKSLTMIPLESVDRLIRQKINSLKAESEDNNAEVN